MLVWLGLVVLFCLVLVLLAGLLIGFVAASCYLVANLLLCRWRVCLVFAVVLLVVWGYCSWLLRFVLLLFVCFVLVCLVVLVC